MVAIRKNDFCFFCTNGNPTIMPCPRLPQNSSQRCAASKTIAKFHRQLSTGELIPPPGLDSQPPQKSKNVFLPPPGLSSESQLQIIFAETFFVTSLFVISPKTIKEINAKCRYQ